MGMTMRLGQWRALQQKFVDMKPANADLERLINDPNMHEDCIVEVTGNTVKVIRDENGKEVGE